jgi:hypothetical protein
MNKKTLTKLANELENNETLDWDLGSLNECFVGNSAKLFGHYHDVRSFAEFHDLPSLYEAYNLCIPHVDMEKTKPENSCSVYSINKQDAVKVLNNFIKTGKQNYDVVCDCVIDTEHYKEIYP